MRTLICLTIVLLIAGTALGEQSLRIAAERFEYGLIPPNCTVEHSFWFHSEGSDTVVIDTIITGCTCTIAQMESNRIAPGDSMRVGFEWELDRRIGAVGKYPRAEFDGPGSPARVYLRGMVISNPDSAVPLSFSPYKLELSRAGHVDIDSVVFTLTNRAEEPLALRLVSEPALEYDVILPDTIPIGGSAQGMIRVRPEYADQEFVSSITIQADDALHSRITMPVRRKFY